MSLHLYPIDHLPVGAVNAGRIIPGDNTNNPGGGGLRLTDYELEGSTLRSAGSVDLSIAIYVVSGVKYLRTCADWYGGTGPDNFVLRFPAKKISEDATRLFFGFRIKMNGQNLPRQHPLYLRKDAGVNPAADFGLVYVDDIKPWVNGGEKYIEISIGVGSAADGIVRRWVDGKRLPDIYLTAALADLIPSKLKFYPSSGGHTFQTPIRDIYLAADDGDNPITTRLGAIRETQLPVTVEQADGWVSDSTDTIEEFLNLPMSNTAPFDGTIKTTTLAPLSYKADTSQLKDTDIIVGVVGAISNSRDAGMLIQQTTDVTGTDISTTDTQDLATVPFLLNTYINPNQFDTQFPFTKEQVGSIVTTLSYDVIDED